MKPPIHNHITDSTAEHYFFTVETNDSAMRLDKFVADKLSHYSRSFLQNQIEKGNVKINDIAAIKSNIKLHINDRINIIIVKRTPLDVTILKQATNGLGIVYEHEHFLIINKPAGLLVHAPHKNSTEPSVADWLVNKEHNIKNIGQEDRPGIVHRLDKDTSGVMIVARTEYGHMRLGQLFRNREIHKTYCTVVQGHSPATGLIDAPIGRDQINKVRMKTFSPGSEEQYKTIRSALTNFRTISYFADYSFIEAQPVTGRTHQIRVHMASIGHPIIGDAVYGLKSNLINRQALHAQRIAFNFDGTAMEYSVPLPVDMMIFIDNFKKTTL